MSLRTLAESRTALVLGVAVSVIVPALTLPHLPQVTLWPVLLGLAPWVIGKYLLCALRWRVLTDAGLSRRWHLRAYAESELLGLLTPGHVGADVWRIHRLDPGGLGRADAVASVGLDRFVGAVALVACVGFAGAGLPVRMLLTVLGVGLVVVGGTGAGPDPSRPDAAPPLPRPRQLAHALVLSTGYQLTIAGLLLGTVAATGHTLSPFAVLGAFGASQLAGAVPGPNGASPRDAALVVALAALGIPWGAAAGAVALKAALAWVPALALGGGSLLLTRRARRARAAAEDHRAAAEDHRAAAEGHRAPAEAA